MKVKGTFQIIAIAFARVLGWELGDVIPNPFANRTPPGPVIVCTCEIAE